MKLFVWRVPLSGESIHCNKRPPNKTLMDACGDQSCRRAIITQLSRLPAGSSLIVHPVAGMSLTAPQQAHDAQQARQKSSPHTMRKALPTQQTSHWTQQTSHRHDWLLLLQLAATQPTCPDPGLFAAATSLTIISSSSAVKGAAFASWTYPALLAMLLPLSLLLAS